MNDLTLPTASRFRNRVIALSWWVSMPGLAVILAFLSSLLRMTPDQWAWFLTSTALYATTTSYPTMRIQMRILAPITAFLERRGAGPAEGPAADADHVAFATVIDLPRRLAGVASLGWVVPCFLVSILMLVRFDTFGAAEAAVVALAGIAAGFVTGSFMVFVVKREVQSVRLALAATIQDPEQRRKLIRPMSLHSKAVVCVTGVTVLPIVFAMALLFAKASERLEGFTIDWQRRVLESIAPALERDGLDRALATTLGVGAVLPAPLDVVRLDTRSRGADAPLEAWLVDDIFERLAAGATHGDSVGLPSDQLFNWRATAAGTVLLASTPRSALRLDGGAIVIQFALLLLVAAAVGFALARLLAGDVCGAILALQSEAERMASGDLRSGHTFESEDEIGDLARSFAGMGNSLRITVARVADAADRIESTATEMASVAENVAAVTADQVSGIQQASASMEAINSQVGGIADSARTLNGSVEESSSSILELGASGQDLNDTAETLNERVEEVSGSIEQMVRSVRQVAEITASLAQASDETSSSMEEMASSLREVDSAAEETARLSREVVTSAESGQTKVRQTIDGMDAIRVATETAEQVIRNLGERTREIGAIVDVIDDVADETNLLALNAAIIAAQAGEQGKAFSVVADEIKDLADRVLASTKEIGSLIRAVQEEGNNAIGAIEFGTQSVASGVDLSAEAGISLEEITRASRESGTRIQEIVTAMRGQSRAAAHVVELMERVRSGVEEIRNSAAEQDAGNQVVYRSATTMREVAQQVRGTTEEQARGSGRIRESVEEVRDTVEQINNALQEQSAACHSAVEFLEEVFARTRSNEESARRMDAATKGLLRQSTELRDDVHRFRI